MSDFEKVYIMSYKNEGKWNPIMQLSKKRFTKNGFKPKVIEGYNNKKHPEIKRNQIVYKNLLDKVIPYVKKTKMTDGFFVAEDDAFPADFTTPAFLKKRLSKLDYKNTIVRVGYQKVLTMDGPSYPRNYFCVGDQLIWIPKSLISKLEIVMKQVNAQHLNGFLSKTMELPVELLDKKIQIDKRHKYILEVEHTSLTMDKTRKGKRESSIERDKKKSTRQQFFSNLNTVRSVAINRKTNRNANKNLTRKNRKYRKNLKNLTRKN